MKCIFEAHLLSYLVRAKSSHQQGYDSKSNSLTATQYKDEIQTAINELESGADKGKTSEEIYKSISNAFDLE